VPGLPHNRAGRFAILLCWVVLSATVSWLCAQETPADHVLAAMKQELNRSFQNFKKGSVPPYFLSYQLTDNRALQIIGSFGTLTSVDDHRTRLLDIDLRVGDYALDNTHPLRGGDFSFPDFGDPVERETIPLENDSLPLRMALWYATEKKYKHAVERLAQVRANV